MAKELNLHILSPSFQRSNRKALPSPWHHKRGVEQRARAAAKQRVRAPGGTGDTLPASVQPDLLPAAGLPLQHGNRQSRHTDHIDLLNWY